MRFGTKAMILTGLAVPAIATMIVAGAGTASAQTASPAASSISTVANFPPPFCSIFQKERWNLNGFNNVDVTYLGTLHFTYTVDFVQRGSCLNGWLDDPYFHVLRPIYGTVYGNTVTFSFTYPSFVEGTRTYYGHIGGFGFVYGGWSQTGTAWPNFGSFSLGGPAARACPPWVWWTSFCTVP
jgi:hypothetical protein